MCFRPAGVEGADTSKIPCPECGELNMNSRKTCYNCGAELPKAADGPAFPDAFAPAMPTSPKPSAAPGPVGAPAPAVAPGAPPAFPDAFGAAKPATSAPVFPDAFGTPKQ